MTHKRVYAYGWLMICCTTYWVTTGRAHIIGAHANARRTCVPDVCTAHTAGPESAWMVRVFSRPQRRVKNRPIVIDVEVIAVRTRERRASSVYHHRHRRHHTHESVIARYAPRVLAHRRLICGAPRRSLSHLALGMCLFIMYYAYSLCIGASSCPHIIHVCVCAQHTKPGVRVGTI